MPALPAENDRLTRRFPLSTVLEATWNEKPGYVVFAGSTVN